MNLWVSTIQGFLVQVTLLSFPTKLYYVELFSVELSAFILSFLSTKYLVECTTLASVLVLLLPKFYLKFLSEDEFS
jgi:hypothetical protein